MENVQTSRARSRVIGLLALAILVALVAAVSAYASSGSGSSANGGGSSATPTSPGLVQTQDEQSPQQPRGDDCPHGDGQSSAPDAATETPNSEL
jgi:hypothetical protein